MTERIVAAAIRFNGTVLSLPPPARHHHLIRHVSTLNANVRVTQEMQGFVTSEGRFVDRREAMLIARAQGQLIARAGSHMQGARGIPYAYEGLGESDEYRALVAEACDGEDGPNTYEWDVGCPP